MQADVTKGADLDRLYQGIKAKHGGLDVLLANAGIALFRPMDQADEAHYDQIMNVNLRGLYFTVAKALPLLRPKSSVILTSSSGSVKGMPGASVYFASKAAVRSLARSWTAEIPPEKARFNVISPGPVATPIAERMGMPKAEVDAFFEQIKNTLPARRMGRPEEIAGAAAFLASDESSFVMGSDFFVDGGISQI